MKPVAFVLAVLSVLAPGLALAEGCHHGGKVKMSCAEGQTWDAATKRCAPAVG